MKKTTIYLPDSLKRRIEAVARLEQRSEAAIIRDAISDSVRTHAKPSPKVPLTGRGLGDPTISERVDEYLEQFGR